MKSERPLVMSTRAMPFRSSSTQSVSPLFDTRIGARSPGRSTCTNFAPAGEAAARTFGVGLALGCGDADGWALGLGCADAVGAADGDVVASAVGVGDAIALSTAAGASADAIPSRPTMLNFLV